jgi:hypothetical protein
MVQALNAQRISREGRTVWSMSPKGFEKSTSAPTFNPPQIERKDDLAGYA